MEYRVLRADAAAAYESAVWSVYEAVWDDRNEADWRATTWQRHLGRPGFRLVVATEPDDRPVGFAYGYTGNRGEYWPDRVLEVLPAEVTDVWVGGHFELVELAVLEQARGQGVGRRLHDLLLGNLPHDRAMLSTEDADTPASRLYRSSGWQALGPLGPGVQVMGKLLSRG